MKIPAKKPKVFTGTLPVNYNDIDYRQRKLVREAYIARQGFKCYYCGNSLNQLPSQFILEADIDLKLFPPGFLNHPVHLHHNHDTGMTIGAVHSKCNAYLWIYEGE